MISAPLGRDEPTDSVCQDGCQSPLFFSLVCRLASRSEKSNSLILLAEYQDMKESV